ncbi:hypothetical protein [Croceiramulus getboli]|nr:hypothetical protein P8624_01855 [Flavobacteriaceae bacterium YJPT1-3]
MIKDVRTQFNQGFKQEQYEALLQEVEATFGEPCAFRISETPVFISKALSKTLFDACDSLIEQIWNLKLEQVRNRFVPKSLQSPLPLGKPHFLAIDFGLCDDGQGGISPQLIELQAFPTLFFYQPFLGNAFKKYYPQLSKTRLDYFFSNLNDKTYVEELRKVILGKLEPQDVVLVELYPDQQKTRIDFYATQQALGIDIVCMTEVLKEGKQLFRIKDGKKIPIKRIYNRVIQDEVQGTKDLQTQLLLSDDVEVEWVTHPDWFFIISKCIMPLLKHKNVPKSYYLDDYPEDLDLSRFVLKPLFSFAGKGINLRPTAKDIEEIEDKKNYILQEKVTYLPVIQTPSEKRSKVELRMLYVWNEEEDRLKPVINLTRMSQGELINVGHNKEDSWVGSSISFFEK